MKNEQRLLEAVGRAYGRLEHITLGNIHDRLYDCRQDLRHIERIIVEARDAPGGTFDTPPKPVEAGSDDESKPERPSCGTATGPSVVFDAAVVDKPKPKPKSEPERVCAECDRWLSLKLPCPKFGLAMPHPGGPNHPACADFVPLPKPESEPNAADEIGWSPTPNATFCDSCELYHDPRVSCKDIKKAIKKAIKDVSHRPKPKSVPERTCDQCGQWKPGDHDGHEADWCFRYHRAQLGDKTACDDFEPKPAPKITGPEIASANDIAHHGKSPNVLVSEPKPENEPEPVWWCRSCGNLARCDVRAG